MPSLHIQLVVGLIVGLMVREVYELVRRDDDW